MTGEPNTDYSEAGWNTLFEDLPDRFVFAFERVFLSQWQKYDADMAEANESLAKLSAAAAKAIAHDNASRLWNINQ